MARTTFEMNRRRVLETLLTASAVSAIRAPAEACGEAAEYTEEEFLDAHNPDPTLIATHEVADGNISKERRLMVSADGNCLAYAERSKKCFQLERRAASSIEIPAPEGGLLRTAPGARAIVLALNHVGRSRVVVFDPSSGHHEAWGEFHSLSDLQFGLGGLLIAHRLLANRGWAITLLSGKQREQTLALASNPRAIAAGAGQAYFFDGPRPQRLGLSGGQGPSASNLAPLEPLPAVARHAVCNRHGLYAACDAGLFHWAKGKAKLLSTDPNIHSLFTQDDQTFAASARQALSINGESARVLVKAPDENLTQLSPIARSSDLLLVRGATVHRLTPGKPPTPVGGGRAEMRLRGAELFDGKLITWSSQTWRYSDGRGCTRVSPAARYLLR